MNVELRRGITHLQITFSSTSAHPPLQAAKRSEITQTRRLPQLKLILVQIYRRFFSFSPASYAP